MLRYIKYCVLVLVLFGGLCCAMVTSDHEHRTLATGNEEDTLSFELAVGTSIYNLFYALIDGTISEGDFAVGLQSIVSVFDKDELQQEVVYLLFHYFFFHRPFNVAQACDTIDSIFFELPALGVFIDRKVEEMNVPDQVTHFFALLLPHEKMIMTAFLTHYALGKAVKEFNYKPYLSGDRPEFLKFNALVDLVMCTRIDAAIYKDSALPFSFYDFYRSASLSSAIPHFGCAIMVQAFLLGGIVSYFNDETMEVIRAIFADNLEFFTKEDRFLYWPPIHLPFSVVELAALAGAEKIVSYYKDDIPWVQEQFRLNAIQGGNKVVIDAFVGIKTEQEIAQVIRYGMNSFLNLEVVRQKCSYDLLARYAVQFNNVPLLFFCIQNGVDSLSNKLMKYPLHYVAKKGFLTLVCYYASRVQVCVANEQSEIKSIDQFDSYGLTPLAWACKGSFYYAAKMLIEKGAASKRVDLIRRPLAIARSRKSPSIVELLSKHEVKLKEILP
ncbi:MAG: hypothetical protein US69_C0012G0004 [candidate division TM6 bacterium GW2011_GWF2_38_10]|nr:MAG: hypothetical protein US69_C0012G0004 [candidate division TM6 bacterium GW2011_GWF2_38_10]